MPPTRVTMATHQDHLPTRKRSKESVSSSQSEVPDAKKKKVSGKGKEISHPSNQSTAPSPSPHLPSSLLESRPHDGTGMSSSQTTETGGEGAGVMAAAAEGSVTAKKRPLPKNHFLKPQRLSPGSWMTHIASLIVYRCAQSAQSCGLDPREHLNEINWRQMLEGLLRPEDLHMTWYFIRREYSEKTLQSIIESTQPYSELTMESLLREEIRLKYKDAMPKVPPTPYFIFMKSKMEKLKRKHPKLPVTEAAQKIGKKWNAISDEKKEKYKQQYIMLKAAYETQLQIFYDAHPDARPPPKQSTTSSKAKKAAKTTHKPDRPPEEEKRLKELEAQCPKKPLSGYLHFCKKKREKLHRKHPELTPQAVTSKLGKRWKSMDAAARTKYVKLHEEGVLRFKEEIAKFHSENPGAQELLDYARKMKRKKKASTKQSSMVATKPAAVIPQPIHSEVSSQLLVQHHTQSSPHTNITAVTTTRVMKEEDDEEEEETAEVSRGPLVEQNGQVEEGASSSDEDSSDSDSSSSTED